MPGSFPADPIQKGKALGTRLGEVHSWKVLIIIMILFFIIIVIIIVIVIVIVIINLFQLLIREVKKAWSQVLLLNPGH